MAVILVQVKIRVFNFSQTKIRMKKTRFTEVQIIGILNEQEQGMKVSDLCRKHGISEATFYSWKSKYGGMKVDELKRLRELEQENARLKRIVANQSLGIDIIKDVLSKKW
jgi:putative transposase